MGKKKNKQEKKISNTLKIELLGLLFILLAILGSGVPVISEGFIPSGLEYTFRILLGIWYFIASLFLLIIGIFLLIKKRFPHFYHKKMIGFYILFLGLLLLTHIQVFERYTLEGMSIIKFTWTQLKMYVVSDPTSANIGGGMIGGLLLTCFYYLFSTVGTKIIAVFSMLIGIIFIADRSFGEFFSQLKEITKKLWDKSSAHIQKLTTKHAEKAELSEHVLLEEDIEQTPTTYRDSNSDVDSPIIHDFSHSSSEVEETKEDQKQSNEVSSMFPSNSSEEVNSGSYNLPPLELLNGGQRRTHKQNGSHVNKTVKTLEKTFESFGVKASVTQVHTGPTVTRYEVSPEAGVKVSRIVNLHDDLALALAAKDIRIEAPIPGKSAVGIEVPNEKTSVVTLREIVEDTIHHQNKLLFALGRDISGQPMYGELNEMPHLLIAGATGSGKSVCINSIIITILMRAKPDEVKMMMIDPKKVELNMYNGIPHLLTPVVTDPKQASMALMKIVSEMERRYELFSETGTRNIEAYNELVTAYNETASDDEQHENLPYIIVFVDELADLMMVASKDVEDSIARLAQMARAAGIHLIIATQRPSVDVITGVIKANIPSRIAFSVSSQTDSRTIIDTGGAEKLIGRGDMLYLPVGLSKPIRVQGAFLSDEEVQRVIEHCTNEQKVVYEEEMIPDETSEQTSDVDDDLYEDAVQLVTEMQTASVSMLQRRFRIGYNRAARLIDAMEDRGIVGPYEGNRPRIVLVSKTAEDEDEEKTS